MPIRRGTRRAKQPSPPPEPSPEPSPELQVDEQEPEESADEAQEEDDGEGQAPAGDDEGAEDELVKLQFDEPLTWRPGKPIPVSHLLPRLQRLFEELTDMDQDRADKDSMAEVANSLAQRNLIQHKEPPIKAYVASCLVEILRLCAPDAPFTEEQLKAIFTFIITYIIPALKDPLHPYNGQHKQVLTSLTEVKSILLLNDLDGADNLLVHLFSTCFDCVSASTILDSDGNPPADVEAHMTDMLIFLIDESPGLPTKVVEAIIAQFLRPAHFKPAQKSDANGNQSTLLPKKEPPAYVMAKMICSYNPEKMARYVSQYFSDVIMDASSFATRPNGHKQGDDDDDDHAPSGPSEADLKNLSQAHLLIRELWRAAPAVLQNVIPQVEAELSADDVHLRQIATETFGDMISGIGAAGPPLPPNYDPCQYPPIRLVDDAAAAEYDNVLTTPMCSQSFAQTYPVAYSSFLGRNRDKVPQIRAAWTTAAGYVLATDAGGIGLSRDDQAKIVDALGEKLNDTDEKVRLAAVKAIELLSFRDVVTKLGQKGGVDVKGSVLASLADRCRDKKPAVRVEAMVVLSKLWAVAAGEIAAGQEAVTACLANIPRSIIGVFYANDQDLFVLLDRVLYECLVPLGYPPRKPKTLRGAVASSQSPTAAGPFDPDRIRAERMLQLVKSLDAPAKRAFFAIQSRQLQFAKVVSSFVAHCEKFNGGTIDEDEENTTDNLNKAINYISTLFADPQKVRQDLQRFAKLNDRRNYQLIKFAIKSESDFNTVHKAIKELMKRVQGGSSPHMLDTLLPLLYRSSFLMFNRSHLPAIMDCSKTDKDRLGAVAHEVLNEISQRNPDIFKTHVGDLCKTLVEQAPSERRENGPSVVDVLKACASYSRRYPKEIPQDKSFRQTMMNYALYGTPPKAAKYAVNILLARGDDAAMASATNLLKLIMKDWRYESPRLLNKLTALSQLERLAPMVTIDHDEAILDLLVQKILLDVRTGAQEKDPRWVDDADMDEEIQAKCICLKSLANRLRAVEDSKEYKEKAPPVFKLLRTLIVRDGELCKDKETPKHHRSRLLLAAAQLVLKLCAVSKSLDDMLSPRDFDSVALVAQRGEEAVRTRFLAKLQKYLAQNKLRPRFYTAVFLTAFEPREGFRHAVETWVRSRAQSFASSEQPVLEGVLCRLISLLAHHPDYAPDVESLADHAAYLVYYVSNVATEQNLGLLIRYAERAKQTRDAVYPDKSENVYVLSDLAQAVLRKWQEKRNWSFQAYPSRVGLPIGLFSALPSHDVAQEIAEKQYLPEGVDERLDDLIRAVDRKKKRKADDKPEPASKRSKTLPSREKAKPSRSAGGRSGTAKSGTASKQRAAKKKTPAKPRRATSPSTAAAAAISSADRRRSTRASRISTYTERDSDDDDEEMLDGVAEWEYLDDKDDDGSEGESDGGDEGQRENEGGKKTNGGGGAEDDDSELSDAPEIETEVDSAASSPAPAPAQTSAAAKRGALRGKGVKRTGGSSRAGGTRGKGKVNDSDLSDDE